MPRPKNVTDMPHLAALNRSASELDRPKRASQMDILPTAVKNRLFGDIIRTIPNDFTTSLSSTSPTLNNGDQVLFTVTTSSNIGSTMLAIPDLSFYVDSVADANKLPGGSGIDESQWQMIGPWFDWAATDNRNHITKVYIRNISAGAVVVTARARVRFITNINAGTTS